MASRWWIEGQESWSPRLVLRPETSALYAKLCNYDAQAGKCAFQSTVVLDEDIPCDGTCDARRDLWDGTYPAMGVGCECSVDLPRTVKLDMGPNLGES